MSTHSLTCAAITRLGARMSYREKVETGSTDTEPVSSAISVISSKKNGVR